VIVGLVTSLQQLASLGVQELNSEAGIRVRGDCADAARLELDCPQLALTSEQRESLSRLSDLLEQNRVPTEQIAAAVRDARAVLGLSATELARYTPPRSQTRPS
jgi:hypothetical protein